MFIMAAVYGFVVGLPSILAPEALASMSGLPFPTSMVYSTEENFISSLNATRSHADIYTDATVSFSPAEPGRQSVELPLCRHRCL